MIKQHIVGIVIRAYNSYYYVQTEVCEELITCKLRGKFKKNRFALTVGDRVKILLDGDNHASIEEILPRTNSLVRPVVANVEQVLLVFAMRDPDYSLTLIDKMLALYAKAKVRVVLCFNKSELELTEQAQLRQLYGNIGYQILFVSAREKLGLQELKECLQNKITVLAGPSGVGKSSILNAIQEGLKLNTGELSKISRGKHTTRYSELLKLDFGGYIADTPGFSSVDNELFKDDNLTELFEDLRQVARACKFSSCKHDQEPSCAVKEAVATGEIAGSRYQTYMTIYQELKGLRDNFK